MNESREIEQYLSGELNGKEKLLMEARLLIDKKLRSATYWQRFTYSIIKAYSRKLLRKDIATADHKMFSDIEHARFREKINQIFS